jgi:hypothetical protein
MHTQDFAAFVSNHPGVLDIVENQIFTRLREGPPENLREGPPENEHDQIRDAPGGPEGHRAVPDRSGNRLAHAGPRSYRSWLSRQNCTVVHTDVAAFGANERNDEDRGIIRQAISEMTRLALRPAGGTCRCEDRGDGHLIIAPPSIPTERVMEWLLDVFPRELKRHNRIYSEWIRIQLRVAVDVGPIAEDSDGVSGESIIRAARMLDAPVFKDAMADAGATLGIIASPFVYETVIMGGLSSLDPARCTEIPVHVKETNALAWMQLIDPTGTAFPMRELLVA